MANSSEWKIVLDPVHGVIELDPIAVKIIDTREFQRLRFIKQLGCTDYVYPGATHTRFAHSIGVYHLASKMIESLKRWMPKNESIQLEEWEAQSIQIAALCHDLGHGPFSHIYEELCQERNEPDGRWSHQDISCIMVKRIFQRNRSIRRSLKKGIDSIRLIMRLIMGKKVSDMNDDEKKKAYIYQIVSNEENYMDVDKWDYLCRDTMYSGMTGPFLSQRAIAGARVVLTCKTDTSAVHQIGYPEKDALMFYTMFQTRYNLRKYIYQHRVIVGVNIMVKDIFNASESESKMEMEKGNETVKDTSEASESGPKMDNNKTQTPGTSPKTQNVFNFELYPFKTTSKIGESNEDFDKFMNLQGTDKSQEDIQIDKYLRLTDDIISRIRYISEQNGYSKDRPIAKAIKILKWIDKRHFYQRSCEFHLKRGTTYDEAKKAKKECIEQLEKKDKLFSEHIAVELISFTFGMGDDNPMDNMIFYNKGQKESGVLLGYKMPKNKVSHLLGNVFSEYYIRIYVKTPEELEEEQEQEQEEQQEEQQEQEQEEQEQEREDEAEEEEEEVEEEEEDAAIDRINVKMYDIPEHLKQTVEALAQKYDKGSPQDVGVMVRGEDLTSAGTQTDE